MCTVSFVPNTKGFILTSNRDELSIRKSANFPEFEYTKNGTIVLPRDGKAGGTWIASGKDRMICLLNGAFEKHICNPPYRHSRGKVVLDAFEFDNFDDFAQNYDFSNLEPHTLVLVEFSKQLILNELRWDGTKVHFKPLNTNKAHIWSSCTLYSKEIVVKRELLFQEFLSEGALKNKDLEAFHLEGNLGDKTQNFLMKRDDFMQTISLTQVVFQQGNLEMSYLDLLTNSRLKHSFSEISV